MSSSSPADFDPYLAWLGIARFERPADHYRLLGLPRFEDDRQRIEAAATERMNVVREHQAGPYGSFSQPLLAELAAASNCLLGAESKRLYDEQLRQASSPPVARIVAAPVAAPQPPLPAAPPEAANVPAAAEPEIASEHEPARSPLASPAVLFLAMAAAVVLIAGGTYAVGRYWFREGGPSLPISSHRPPVELDEKNPQETQPQPPVRPKRTPGIPPVVVMQEGSGRVNLTPATAALAGKTRLSHLGASEQISGWSEPGDEAAWEFQVVRPGFFELEVIYAAPEETAAAEIEAILDAQAGKTISLPPTSSRQRWSARRQTIAVTAAGRHRLTLQLTDSCQGSLCIKEAGLIPVGSEARDE